MVMIAPSLQEAPFAACPPGQAKPLFSSL